MKKIIYTDEELLEHRTSECPKNLSINISEINNYDYINNNAKIIDNRIINFQNELLEGTFSPLISKIINKDKDDLLIIQKDTIYQITYFEIQNLLLILMKIYYLNIINQVIIIMIYFIYIL